MEDPKWLESLKVGYMVAIRGYMDSLSIRSIARITDKQFIDSKGDRYWRKDGELVGNTDKWHSISIEPLTDAIREEVMRRKFKAVLRDIDINKLSIKQIHDILTIFNKQEG